MLSPQVNSYCSFSMSLSNGQLKIEKKAQQNSKRHIAERHRKIPLATGLSLHLKKTVSSNEGELVYS